MAFNPADEAVAASLHGLDYFEYQYRILGKGNYGVVAHYKWRPRNRPEMEQLDVAVKFILLQGIQPKYLQHEVTNHLTLDHRFIVRCHYIGLTPNREYLYIVMQRARGGDLFKFICRDDPCEARARYFFVQLITGLDYCHKQGIANRDLKLENLLLDVEDANAGSRRYQDRTLLISDFGLCKNSMTNSQPKSQVGTLYYMPPEVITASAHCPYSGPLADVWSAGVVLYVLVFKRYPFGQITQPSGTAAAEAERRMIREAIVAGRWQQADDSRLASAQCLDLLGRILVTDTTKRITIQEIVQHPWFVQGLAPPPQGGQAQGSDGTALLADNDARIHAQVAHAQGAGAGWATWCQTHAEVSAVLQVVMGGNVNVINTSQQPVVVARAADNCVGGDCEEVFLEDPEAQLIEDQIDAEQMEHPSQFYSSMTSSC